MNFKKPQFWNNKNTILPKILLPLSYLFNFLVYIKRKTTSQVEFDLPIICIGNIYLGGTGKTPMTIFLSKELTKLGKRPAIVKKYYSNHEDEHRLIRNYYKYFITSKNRKLGIRKAQSNNNDSVILDDGFQDYEIKKDLNIICFNQNQLVGNGYTLPSGPLREKMNSLKRSDIVMINGKKSEEFEKKILSINSNIEIYYSKYKPLNIKEFKNKKIIAIAGIGNPNNFFELLMQNNLELVEKLDYPDHYKFKKEELEKIIVRAKKNNCQILTTEKDYFRIKDYNLNEIKKVDVILDIEKKENFMKKVIKVYD